MTSPRHLETPAHPATPVRAMRDALVKEAQAARRLEALERAKSGFVTTVGHELRTPLAAMLGYTELLRDGDAGPLNTEQQALLACVERNGARLSGLIDDLIKVARVQSEAFALPMDRVHVNGVVRRAVEACGSALTAIDLDLRIDATDPVTTGSSKELEEVVSQLLSNAVKFTPPGGRVVVTTHHTDTACTIAVSDTGPGISVSEQEEMFDYFFRASSPSHRAAPGVGVGLSLAKAIVRECGGDITVTSGRGHGATFIIRLPLWDGAGEAGRDGEAMAAAEAS
jgi:signal transduction histidine kinase